MATEVWHDLGPVPGACTVCDADDALTMSQVRLRPSLTERLRREHVAQPPRLVTCSACGWRWTVRSTDAPPAAVAAAVARTAVEPAPAQPRAPRPEVAQLSGRHAAAALTVLPGSRGRRALSARLR